MEIYKIRKDALFKNDQRKFIKRRTRKSNCNIGSIKKTTNEDRAVSEDWIIHLVGELRNMNRTIAPFSSFEKHDKYLPKYAYLWKVKICCKAKRKKFEFFIFRAAFLTAHQSSSIQKIVNTRESHFNWTHAGHTVDIALDTI